MVINDNTILPLWIMRDLSRRNFITLDTLWVTRKQTIAKIRLHLRIYLYVNSYLSIINGWEINKYMLICIVFIGTFLTRSNDKRTTVETERENCHRKAKSLWRENEKKSIFTFPHVRPSTLSLTRENHFRVKYSLGDTANRHHAMSYFEPEVKTDHCTIIFGRCFFFFSRSVAKQ